MDDAGGGLGEAGDDGCAFGEITRSKAINWFAAVVLSLLALGLPVLATDLPAFVGSVVARVPGLVSGVAAAVLLELIWRDGLRPRLRWNSAGIMAVYRFRTVFLPWREITTIREGGDVFRHISIETGGGPVTWEFDHLWLADRLSRKYRARLGRHERRLTTELARWKNLPGARSDPPDLPRRPVPLYFLLAATVVGATMVY